MNDIDLSQIDLNLLLVLDHLLDCGSVTETARRLGRTQSAVSHSLRKLRSQLGDALLVRVGQGMETTPHADQLRAPLRKVLSTVRELVTPPASFDPATSTHTFTFFASDYICRVLLSGIYARLHAEAPGVDLRVLRIDSRWPQRLEEGEAELAITPELPARDAHYRTGVLYSDRFVTLVPPDRRLDDVPLALDGFLARPHVLVSPEGHPGSTVQAILDPLSRTRRIGLETPYFLGATEAAAEANVYITMPERLVAHLARPSQTVVETPIPMVAFHVRQIWHARTDANPVSRWLRQLITSVAAGLRPGPAVPPGPSPYTPP